MTSTEEKLVVIKQTLVEQLQVMINMVVKLAHSKRTPMAQ